MKDSELLLKTAQILSEGHEFGCLALQDFIIRAEAQATPYDYLLRLEQRAQAKKKATRIVRQWVRPFAPKRFVNRESGYFGWPQGETDGVSNQKIRAAAFYLAAAWAKSEGK